MNDCQADIIEMRLDDMRELLDDTFSCVGCKESSCRFCDISRRRREALSDDEAV